MVTVSDTPEQGHGSILSVTEGVLSGEVTWLTSNRAPGAWSGMVHVEI